MPACFTVDFLYFHLVVWDIHRHLCFLVVWFEFQKALVWAKTWSGYFNLADVKQGMTRVSQEGAQRINTVDRSLDLSKKEQGCWAARQVGSGLKTVDRGQAQPSDGPASLGWWGSSKAEPENPGSRSRLAPALRISDEPPASREASLGLGQPCAFTHQLCTQDPDKVWDKKRLQVLGADFHHNHYKMSWRVFRKKFVKAGSTTGFLLILSQSLNTGD